MKTKGERFRFPPFQDKRFEIGASHRVDAAPLGHDVDSLDGNQYPGFIRSYKFPDPLGEDVKTSNTGIQLFYHSEVVAALNDKAIPIMGGISGTTRDIFQYCTELRPTNFWYVFSVVAAFMIKHHYHSLIECFIVAQQYYLCGKQDAFIYRNEFTSESLYKHIRLMTGVQFV